MKPIALLIPGLLIASLFLIAACGGGQDAPAQTEPQPAKPTAASPSGDGSGGGSGSGSGSGGGTGDAVSFGQGLFSGSAGCAGCHTIEGVSAGLVGPDLTKAGADAASRKSGMSARDYIEESIRDPEAFVADGVERAMAGVMTKAITAGLTDEQVEALVDFLAGQK